MFVTGTSGQSGDFTEFTKKSGTRHIAIGGPGSTPGRKPTLNQTGISGWLNDYIMKDTKDLAKIIQLFTYLIDEPGQVLAKYGAEGATYVYGDQGKIDYLPEMKKLKQVDNDAYNRKYGISCFLYFSNDRINKLKVSTKSALARMQEWGRGKLAPHFVIENINPDIRTPEVCANEAIEAKLNTTVISMIHAKDDKAFDKSLEDHKAFLKPNKWDTIEKIKSEEAAENRDKLK